MNLQLLNYDQQFAYELVHIKKTNKVEQNCENGNESKYFPIIKPVGYQLKSLKGFSSFKCIMNMRNVHSYVQYEYFETWHCREHVLRLQKKINDRFSKK